MVATIKALGYLVHLGSIIFNESVDSSILSGIKHPIIGMLKLGMEDMARNMPELSTVFFLNSKLD